VTVFEQTKFHSIVRILAQVKNDIIIVTDDSLRHFSQHGVTLKMTCKMSTGCGWKVGHLAYRPCSRKQFRSSGQHQNQTPSTGSFNIFPSTTAVFSYATGSRKLSTNEQFFGGAQTVVRLLQTTQIKQGVSFTATNKVYTSTNKTTIFYLPGVDASHVYVSALALGCFYSQSALTPSLDSCSEINSAPSVA